MTSTLSKTLAEAALERKGTLTLLTAAALIGGTASRSLMWFDSGELALASATWGLGHPPGQPLYTLVGGLCYQLGGLVGLNLLSALSLVALLAALRALYTLGGALSLRSEFLGLLWLALYPVWDQGTRVELYAFSAALGFWSLYWAKLSAQEPQRVDAVRSATLRAGLLLGACGASNAVFAVAFGLSLLWAWAPRDLRGLSRLCSGAAIGLALPYLYLIWAASASSGFVWGELKSLEGLWAYLSGSDYRGTAHSDWSQVPRHLLEWLVWSYEVGAGLWCSLAALLSLSDLKRSKLWGLPLIVTCGLFPLSYGRYWPEVPDFTGYLLPIMGLSLLVIWRLEGELSRHKPRGSLTSLLLICSLSLAHLSAPSGPQLSRPQHTLPVQLAGDWLQRLPEGAALFVGSDHWVFPLMYLQEVEGLRKDVLIFNTGFSRSAWYWRWLRQRHPTLPQVEGLGRQRLSALASRWSGPIYTESLALSAQLTLRLTAPPSLLSPKASAPPCPAAWGVSLGCERPLPELNAAQLQTLAQTQGPLSPISARVLAAHSANLSLAYWSVGDATRALSLGYAALGSAVPLEAQRAQWWPAPPQLWAQGRGILIGAPELSRELLTALSKRQPRGP